MGEPMMGQPAGLPTFRTSIEPGQWVMHPEHRDWGMGQVQSAVGTRVTVNFEHRGKVLINAALVDLQIQYQITSR
ncbi:DUF3553 domain-containing protein [Lichenicoccus roseus]|nr:DUF3553 domain-containing protein [Lichenicoccus roseus]